jgi:hypothetical protein
VPVVEWQALCLCFTQHVQTSQPKSTTSALLQLLHASQPANTLVNHPAPVCQSPACNSSRRSSYQATHTELCGHDRTLRTLTTDV